MIVLCVQHGLLLVLNDLLKSNCYWSGLRNGILVKLELDKLGKILNKIINVPVIGECSTLFLVEIFRIKNLQMDQEYARWVNLCESEILNNFMSLIYAGNDTLLKYLDDAELTLLKCFIASFNLLSNLTAIVEKLNGYEKFDLEEIIT